MKNNNIKFMKKFSPDLPHGKAGGSGYPIYAKLVSASRLELVSASKDLANSRIMLLKKYKMHLKKL
jgi:hypothetical protein